MSKEKCLRNRILNREKLAGIFIKTPAYEVVEILAKSGLDFGVLDAEHSPFDRGRLDACLAIARALNFPMLVRVHAGRPENILTALDSGATGIVVPHVDTMEKALDIAKAARFGHGGRGISGATRWAGYSSRSLAELIEVSHRETVVIAQIEEPEGVEIAAEIAAIDGIDGLFVGPADLAVCYGDTSPTSERVQNAMQKVGDCARDNGKALMTFAPDAKGAEVLRRLGVTAFVAASDQTHMFNGAKALTQQIHDLD